MTKFETDKDLKMREGLFLSTLCDTVLRHIWQIKILIQDLLISYKDTPKKGVGGNVYMKGITIDVLLKECFEK